MPAVFNPDEPFVEETPRFDASKPFVEESSPRFDASKPFEVEGAPTSTATTPAPSITPDDTIAAFRAQSSAQMMSPRITQRDILAAEQENIASEVAPITSKIAAKVASGLENGMAMPERAIRGGLDFLGFYGALDATLGTGTKYQDYNRGWLEHFNKREQRLSKEDADLGATGFGYDATEGVARAAVELPTQLLGGAAGAARSAAVKGAAITAGVIGGLSQYAQDRGAGKDKTESAIYGGVSGAITGLTTAAFGVTGVESIFKNEGARGVGNRILNVLKQAGFEGAEESVDQFQQDLLERTARNPNKPIGDSVREVLLAGSIGTLIGGAASSLSELGGGGLSPERAALAAVDAPLTGAAIEGINLPELNAALRAPPAIAGEVSLTPATDAATLPSSAKPEEAATAVEPSTNTPVSEGQVPPSPVKLGGAEADLPTAQRETSQRNNAAQAELMRKELEAMGLKVPEPVRAENAQAERLNFLKTQERRESLTKAESRELGELEAQEAAKKAVERKGYDEQRAKKLAAEAAQEERDVTLAAMEANPDLSLKAETVAKSPEQVAALDAAIEKARKEMDAVWERKERLPKGKERDSLSDAYDSALTQMTWNKRLRDMVRVHQETSRAALPEPSPAAPKPAEAAVAEPIGMGGAVPSEFAQSPQTATSIKNATVDVERSKRGLPPAMQPQRRKWGTVWDEAMAKIDNDPGYPDRLITELRDKPRALNDLEDATLLHRQIDLHNEHGKATRDLAQAFDDGRIEAVANEKARVNAISDQLLDLYNINKSAGTATGRGLAARRMMAYEDFTLAKMELDKRAANDGASLTDVQREEVVRLNKRIEDTQKAFDDYVSKTESANAERAIADALAEVERGAAKEPAVEPHVKIIADKIKVYFDNRADAALKRLSGKLFTISPQVLADLTDLGVSRILGGAASFTGWSAKMVEVLGDKIKPHLQTVWESSQRALTEHVEKVAGPQKEKVKRAATGATVNEQITSTKAAVTEKVNAGQRSDISSLAQKLARLFVEQGIKERDPLIDAVHEALKEADPEFTRREAMDAISGYGDFKQLSKDEISKQLRDLKGQMQQVAKLEDMQAGKPPLKTGIERRIPSPEESRLIKQVNESKNKFQIPIDDPNTQLKSSLDTLKTRLRNRTADLQDRLKRKDFEKKPRRIIQMDAEANRLSFEAAKAKIEWHEALMKDRLARRSVTQKILAGAGEVLNTSRAVITSADFSAVLRQGGFIALAHPVRAARSLPAMFRAFRSEAGQHAVNQEIIARKNYQLYQQGKLYLSEHGQKLSQMEEAYMSRWANKIPIVAGSQRAYVTFLNKLRADSFDAMANSLTRSGELTPVEVNAISNFINVATGRGNLGMKENALVGLNTVFFAPRYVASRFQLLAGQPLYRGSARTRTAVAKEYARFLIGVAVIYGLAALDGAEIEKDPRSSDFGKLRYGNTRLDPMAGLLQNTVLLSRIVTGETITLKGKTVPIDAVSVIGRFLRTKLSPAFGTALNLLPPRKDVVGNPVTAASTAESLLVPLGMRDILKIMEEEGIPRGTAMGILAIFGVGLQNFDVNKPKADSPK